MLLRAVLLTGLSIGLVAPATAAAAEPSPAQLTQQITTYSVQLEKVVESYNRLNEERKQTKAAADALAKKLAPLEQQLGTARSELGELASTAYKNGGLSTAGALLDAESDTLLSQLGALDQLARSRQERVDGYTATRQRYDTEQKRLSAALARQNAQAKQLGARKKKIEAQLDKLYEMRRNAYGSATSAGSGYRGPVPSVLGSAGVAVRYAYGAIGKPYVWAAEGPGGYDCSGLTLAAWRAAGTSLPHNTEMQWNVVSHISRSALSPGDLVFYSGLGHVALYVGGGKVIHAPTFGESVTLASVDMMPPMGYGRVR
ncbi:Cell wall-associated hydrolase, NlpC family [Micromonospora pattaloongensis]|uniref:Cell wall-associated hydrolase, NlpC family n=2 Tax=Micromonospora pattaloongensis TaxID=405436 RepID=A0A1H3FJX2_9ACTN|nr:Cell wall-associated hydrolase, NlpC family [Micromonospora pattaloongensis]